MATEAIPSPNVAKVDSLTSADSNDKKNNLPSNPPALGVGIVEGTIVDNLNSQISHVCDFSLDIQKNIGLKKYIKAISRFIRDGIRAVKLALGFGEPSGVIFAVIEKLKAAAAFVRYVQKEYIQPVLDFQKYVLDVVVKIKKLIQWILSLPAKIFAMLKGCLTRLYKTIASIFSDAWNEATAEEAADFAAQNPTSDLITEPPGTPEEGSFSELRETASNLNGDINKLTQEVETAVKDTVTILASATNLTSVSTTDGDLDPEFIETILVEVKESSANATLVSENNLNNVSNVTNASGV
tara:strand:+ start:156 stop:1046 length:891 start_codon:yes stop_codon:yes gene_type:complete